MSGSAGADALGWAGLLTGVGGVVVYLAIALRQPELVRLLNGAGLLLTSVALWQARTILAAATGPAAFPAQAAIVLLILAVLAQAAAGLRNRRAWDGGERRRAAAWDGAERRSRRGLGEDHT